MAQQKLKAQIGELFHGPNLGIEPQSSTLTAALDDTGGPADGKRCTVLTFQLDRQIYAFPIESIVQIIPMVTIQPVPQVNVLLEGVINYHGTTVPVVDLRRHLELAPLPLELYTPIILLRIGEQTVGLIVDQVIDIPTLAEDELDDPAEFIPAELAEAPVLLGLGFTGQGLVILIDPQRLFRPDQVQAIIQATQALAEIADNHAGESLPGEEE